MGINPDTVPQIPRAMPLKKLQLLFIHPGASPDSEETLLKWEKKAFGNPAQYAWVIQGYGEKLPSVDTAATIFDYEDSRIPGYFRALFPGGVNVSLTLGKDHDATPIMRIRKKEIHYPNREMAAEDFVEIVGDMEKEKGHQKDRAGTIREIAIGLGSFRSGAYEREDMSDVRLTRHLVDIAETFESLIPDKTAIGKDGRLPWSAEDTYAKWNEMERRKEGAR